MTARVVRLRELIIHNALYRIEEFNLDGPRLDAVHAIKDDGPRHHGRTGEHVVQRLPMIRDICFFKPNMTMTRLSLDECCAANVAPGICLDSASQSPLSKIRSQAPNSQTES